jgi:hypothetical protein
MQKALGSDRFHVHGQPDASERPPAASMERQVPALVPQLAVNLGGDREANLFVATVSERRVPCST